MTSKNLLLTLLIFLTGFGSPIFGQSRRSSVTFDLGGSRAIIGVGYDYRFTKNVNNFGINAGIGLFSISASGYTINNKSELVDVNSSISALLLPVMANGLFGGRNHHFELGIGLVPLFHSADANFHHDSKEGHFRGNGLGMSGTFLLGYRYQRPQGGFVFKAGINPMFKLPGIDNYIATSPFWPYISLGYSF